MNLINTCFIISSMVILNCYVLYFISLNNVIYLCFKFYLAICYIDNLLDEIYYMWGKVSFYNYTNVFLIINLIFLIIDRPTEGRIVIK